MTTKEDSDLYYDGNLIFSPGDIVDKISILNIKEGKGLNTKQETLLLDHTLSKICDYEKLTEDKRAILLMYHDILFHINTILWDLEDLVRNSGEERNLEAQSCRKVNHLRVQTKNYINDLFNFPHEKKLYR